MELYKHVYALVIEMYVSGNMCIACEEVYVLFSVQWKSKESSGEIGMDHNDWLWNDTAVHI